VNSVVIFGCGDARMTFVPFIAFPLPSHDSALDEVAVVLDPGFAEGQLGASAQQAQVIFCRGDEDSDDGGCTDLVIDLEASPAWRIIDVRYWGFPTTTTSTFSWLRSRERSRLISCSAQSRRLGPPCLRKR